MAAATCPLPRPRSVPPLCTVCVCVTLTPGPVCASVCPQWPPLLRASLLKGGQGACCSAELFSGAARFHLAARISGRGGAGSWKDCLLTIPEHSALSPRGEP